MSWVTRLSATSARLLCRPSCKKYHASASEALIHIFHDRCLIIMMKSRSCVSNNIGHNVGHKAGYSVGVRASDMTTQVEDDNY